MSSLPINFSSGSLFMVRNDTGVVNPAPVKIGILQEGSIDFQGTNKELYGQYQFPVDVARGPIKVTGKAKSAQIFSSYWDLFFGQGVTQSAGVGVALNEAHSVPATSTYTIQATNHTTLTQDLGLSYAATGIPLIPVSSLTAAGQYTGPVSGTYTFDAADASAPLLLSYEYTMTTNPEIVINNALMGTSPTFLMSLATTYKGNVMNLHLNQCISEKLSFPFKNTDYSILELDFSAYVNAAGVLGTITFSE